jgi:hypothetical protein
LKDKNMRIYHAAMKLQVLLKYHELFPHKKLNILRSYGLPSSENRNFMETHRDKIGSLILDSGTWTLNNPAAGKSGFKVTLGGYLNYAKQCAPLFDFIFNFDSDFSEKGFATNLENQKRLEDAGLNPVPVIHDIYGEEIDYYIDQDYPCVALGSFQITSLDTLKWVVEKIHAAALKVHLFGTSRFDYIAKVPVFSCDSTTWVQTGAFGCLFYWNPDKSEENKTDKIYLEEYLPSKSKREVTFSDYFYREELEAYLKNTFGISHQDLLGPEGDLYQRLVNLHHLIQLEELVTKMHKAKKPLNSQ